MRGLLRPERRARQVVLPSRRRWPPAWFIALANKLPKGARDILVGQPPPEAKPLTGSIQWRKHWLDFLRRAGLPLLVVLLLLLMIVLTAALGPDLRYPLWAGELFLLVVALLASLYYVTDYRNDLYIVTDEKLMDIEAKPLGLSFKQRDAGLDRVQTVSIEQKGFWAWLFNYGDVLIRTAAADEGLTFSMVRNPKRVQKTISQKLDAFKRRQEEKTLAANQRLIIEGLEVYQEVQEQLRR